MIFRLRASFSPADCFFPAVVPCRPLASGEEEPEGLCDSEKSCSETTLSGAWWLLNEDSTHIKRVFFVIVETLSWCCCLFFWLEDARDWLAPEAILKARPDETNKVQTCVTEKLIGSRDIF